MANLIRCFIIILVLLLNSSLLSQEKNDAKLKELYSKINELQERGDEIALIETLVQIIDLRPEYIVPRKMIAGILSQNKDKLRRELINRPGLLEKAVSYCVENPASTIQLEYSIPYYYKNHDKEKIREVLSNVVNGNYKPVLTGNILLSMDPEIDKELYNEIVQILIRFVDNESKIGLAVNYYQLNQTDNLARITDQINFTQKPEILKPSVLVKLDPSVNASEFKSIFPKISSLFSKENILKINDPDILYKLGRNFFFCGDGLTASSVFGKIYDLLEKNPSEDFNYLFYWGISCLFKDQQYRARLIFDQIYKFGDDSVRANLEIGLKWWNRNLFYTTYTNELLNTYFGDTDTETNAQEPPSSFTENNDHLPEFVKVEGKYYALIIGVADYLDSRISSLFHPVIDAEKFASLLKTEFTFEKENVILLENPVRKDILKELYKFRKTLNEADNLLIFYAGHGVWDSDIQQGYWLPSDAQHDDISNWISNSDIRDYIRGIKSKHTLLISDACFSGGIFKSRESTDNIVNSLSETYKYISRRAITSGAVKTVPDKSVFVEYLIRRLREEKEKYITSQQLYMSMKDAVINNSPLNQTPLYGIIKETGDEGPGDFIFIKK